MVDVIYCRAAWDGSQLHLVLNCRLMIVTGVPNSSAAFLISFPMDECPVRETVRGIGLVDMEQPVRQNGWIVHLHRPILAHPDSGE